MWERALRSRIQILWSANRSKPFSVLTPQRFITAFGGAETEADAESETTSYMRQASAHRGSA